MIIGFLAPALFVYSLFFVYPAIRAVFASLFDWTGFGSKMRFIGLDNYREIATDAVFWQALGRTLFISVVGGIVMFSLALFFGGILLRPLRGKRFFRAILFFPVVLPGIAIGVMWQFLYNYDWGPVSSVIRGLGLTELDRPWLAPDTIIAALTVAIVWTYAGYYLVLMLAAIDRVPRDLLEAARIDGAGEWTIYRRVVLPLVRDVLLVALILWVIGSLKIFDVIAAVTLPNPPVGTYTLSIYIWAESIAGKPPIFRLGYGTAIGVVLLILVVSGVAISRLIGSRDSVEY
jgi:ABC-type sugar transport system permease subunit